MYPYFRRRRFQWFVDAVAPSREETILDVGGRPGTWCPYPPVARQIDVLNRLEDGEDWGWEESEFETHNIRKLVGDGCDLQVDDEEYDIVFSNSVIEHVGTWENQLLFAKEVRRAGKRLWVQTPAREFIIEPHYIAPFIHWVPKRVRKYLLRHFTIWGWMTRPSLERAQASVDEIRLLSFKEFKQLFPDCEIIVERFMWILPKSYFAKR